MISRLEVSYHVGRDLCSAHFRHSGTSLSSCRSASSNISLSDVVFITLLPKEIEYIAMASLPKKIFSCFRPGRMWLSEQ